MDDKVLYMATGTVSMGTWRGRILRQVHPKQAIVAKIANQFFSLVDIIFYRPRISVSIK